MIHFILKENEEEEKKKKIKWWHWMNEWDGVPQPDPFIVIIIRLVCRLQKSFIYFLSRFAGGDDFFLYPETDAKNHFMIIYLWTNEFMNVITPTCEKKYLTSGDGQRMTKKKLTKCKKNDSWSLRYDYYESSLPLDPLISPIGNIFFSSLRCLGVLWYTLSSGLIRSHVISICV